MLDVDEALDFKVVAPDRPRVCQVDIALELRTHLTARANETAVGIMLGHEQ